MSPPLKIDATFVVSLPKRADRRANLMTRLKKVRWPWPTPEYWPGVTATAPADYEWGSGAYGCLLAHRNLLKWVQEKELTALILEDDVVWGPDLPYKWTEFVADVPADWDALMLGGQHLEPPTPLSGGTYKVNNGNRTHAYLVQPGRYLDAVVTALETPDHHVDYMMGRLHASYNVYAPKRWLMGQARGTSDVLTKMRNRMRPLPERFWNYHVK